MDIDNRIEYTVVYRYVCTCDAINSGSIIVRAGNADGAEEKAGKARFTCHACSRTTNPERLKVQVEMRSV